MQIIDIKSLITKYVGSGILSRDQYDWPVNHAKLPFGIKVAGDTNFAQNVDLKYKLNDIWNKLLINHSYRDLYLVAQYYVSTWGGIHRNSRRTINNYISKDPSLLIHEQQKKGIASWSKILCIRDPDKYPIFDARVALALNALQLTGEVKKPEFLRFPALPSRNKEVKRGNALLNLYLESQRIAIVTNFYPTYIEILGATAASARCKICEVEMCLFARAEQLCSEVIKKLKL